MSTFQAISKRHERSPREAEIERVRDVLKAAIKSSEKSLSTERREADRALSDAVAPLPADALGLDDDASYDLGPRWGDAESAKALTPSAFFVEENASEPERTRRGRGSREREAPDERAGGARANARTSRAVEPRGGDVTRRAAGPSNGNINFTETKNCLAGSMTPRF